MEIEVIDGGGGGSGGSIEMGPKTGPSWVDRISQALKGIGSPQREAEAG